MVESVPFLILLVFLVLAVIFFVEALCNQKPQHNNFCFILITHFAEWFHRFWGNHQKIFGFLLKKKMKYKTVLMLFNSFLLVVLVITLLVMSSPNNNSESWAHFYPSVLAIKATRNMISLCYTMVELTWPGVAIESVYFCIRSDIAFKILVAVWSLLGF